MFPIRRFGREWLVLTLFTVAVWQALYIPLCLILGFSWPQFFLWMTIGSVYDYVVAYPISKATIGFDRKARSRGWYGSITGTRTGEAAHSEYIAVVGRPSPKARSVYSRLSLSAKAQPIPRPLTPSDDVQITGHYPPMGPSRRPCPW
jgi:hypothetical protein